MAKIDDGGKAVADFLEQIRLYLEAQKMIDNVVFGEHVDGPPVEDEDDQCEDGAC